MRETELCEKAASEAEQAILFPMLYLSMFARDRGVKGIDELAVHKLFEPRNVGGSGLNFCWIIVYPDYVGVTGGGIFLGTYTFSPLLHRDIELALRLGYLRHDEADSKQLLLTEKTLALVNR